ncbi:MAG: response regulator [Bdellovibrionales bacterium]|nr:response regulator [Bdellovibrionales bacterium]
MIKEKLDGDLPMYELILTDINMPEMDGLKLLELVRAEPKTSNIPVLIVTTDGGKPTVIKAVMSGVSGYMVKPFGVEDVKNKILEIYKRKSEMGDSTSPS